MTSGPSQTSRRRTRPTPAGRRGRPGPPSCTVVPLLQPGSFVRLRNHPADLPPFELIACQGGRCWVRQQSWGPWVQWEVAYRQLTAAA